MEVDKSLPVSPKVENNNDWSCFYYPETLRLPEPEKESSSSSCSPSSTSSDEIEFESKVCGTTPRTKSRKLKKKFKARDRDNEIDYILKRKSLQLCRQSSNASVASDQTTDVIRKRVLSRQNSSGSSVSVMDSYQANPNGDIGQLEQSATPSSTPASPPPPLHQRVVAQLAKHLRANCDKILDMSVPFVLDSCVLWSVSEAVNELLSNHPMPETEEEEDVARSEYVHQVMFLADVLEQTPTLCISLSELNSIPGNMDLTLFRNLQVLELRKIPPHMVSGINTIRINLKKLKCARCLDSLREVFCTANTTAELLPTSASSPPGSVFPISSLSMTLTSVWPELREIDASFNRIEVIDTYALEMTPSLEVLNLSRNRISSIEYGFSKLLTNLTVLNLNYNQLTTMPPVPPSLKVLLLSNNYITSLSCSALIGNFKNLETLDISQNMISDETQLESLRHLTSLKNLVCVGNPVSYLEHYRNVLCSNLSRIVLNSKVFVLDKKKLSNSEVRLALEKIRLYQPLPSIPQPGLGSPFPFTSSRVSTSWDRVSDIRSLTQSYDSNSSSVRSACRKKPKIREIVVLDRDDERDGCFKGNVDAENQDPKPRNRKGSNGSEGSSVSATDTLSISEKSEIMVLETRNAITSLRNKYGKENWLLRQAGCEVGKLLGISDKVTKLAELSKSLPVTRDSSFYSAVAVASWNDSHSQGNTEESAPVFEPTSNSAFVQKHDTSDESIKQVTDLSNSSEGIGVVYQSCVSDFDVDSISSGLDEHPPTQAFATSLSTENDPDSFSSQYNRATHFRFFQSGQALQLSILDHFLFEVDPQQIDIVISKWDLKSLKSITEVKSYREADTVEFRLSFDTIRKPLRERSFVMTTSDFKEFNKLASPFLQVRTLQEFADGFQCIKCNAQFSKGMAGVHLVKDQHGAPTEVPVCPNSECRSELLIPLDVESIPLPNNESFNMIEADSSYWAQPALRSSTPISGFLRPKSLPKTGFFPNALDFEKSAPNSNSKSNRVSNNPIIIVGATVPVEDRPDCTARPNGKSDSDIEVLSCDSSSIEVLGKNGGSGSSSDIEVEEAVEIAVPDFAFGFGKPGATVPMTESNSSGSCTESICTTYERTPCPPLSAISQQLSPPIMPANLSLISSTSSTTTITPSHSIFSLSSPSHSSSSAIVASAPIRYDYENYSKIDHRLQLFCDISVFKHHDEKLLSLTKAIVITSSGSFLSIVIFSSQKIYFYKIVGPESDKPEDWLQKTNCYPLAKLNGLDVLVGRHGVGLDFQGGKPHAVIFRDSGRTSKFIEFFLCEICVVIDRPPLIRDLSQTQKTLMSPVNPISYFGFLRFALCESIEKSYSVSALVLTESELMLLNDVSWLVNRNVDKVSPKHIRNLSSLRQVECLEADATYVKLVFELETHVFWDIHFETPEERNVFTATLKSTLATDIPFISLSQPIEP